VKSESEERTKIEMGNECGTQSDVDEFVIGE
jgi:hypothetical protein